MGDSLIKLGGIIPNDTVAESHSSTYNVACDDWGLYSGSIVDVVSRGNDASSVGGDSTPRDLHFTWHMGLLGGVDHVIFYSRCIHSLSLPGLDGHRWCRGQLFCLVNIKKITR